MSRQVALRIPPVCPYCGRTAQLLNGVQVYGAARQDLAHKNFWSCRPCDARVGCHVGTDTPYGTLANARLRVARNAAHEAFDPLWRNGRDFGKRAARYQWLADRLGIPFDECHIGLFDEAMCARVVAICRPVVATMSLVEKNILTPDSNDGTNTPAES